MHFLWFFIILKMLGKINKTYKHKELYWDMYIYMLSCLFTFKLKMTYNDKLISLTSNVPN